MVSRWSEREAARFVERHAEWGAEVAQRVYSARLLGSEPGLVLHGGGNVSVEAQHVDLFGQVCPSIHVKASGHDLATIGPEGLTGLDLDRLRRLGSLEALSDEQMFAEIRRSQHDPEAPLPSLETLLHAWIPGRFVDHTHPDAVLALTNRVDGDALAAEVLGAVVVPYVKPGFALAKVALAALHGHPEARLLVLSGHGMLTWGATAEASYHATIDAVSRAEAHLSPRPRVRHTDPQVARDRLVRVAPVLRGLLAEPTGDPDRPWRPPVLSLDSSAAVLDVVDGAQGEALVRSPVLTTDHLVRTRPTPAWVDAPAWDEPAKLHEQLGQAIAGWSTDYRAYLDRHRDRMPPGVAPLPDIPRVVALPGGGLVCAGVDAREAAVVREISSQTLATKARVGPTYRGLDEHHLFDMEYRAVQHAKLAVSAGALSGRIALITGAAGAIGAGIAQVLLEHGAHVALTDLPGEHLDGAVAELEAHHPTRVCGIPLDVTDEHSVAAGFAAATHRWGGVDLVVPNAGLALVCSLEQMDLAAFRRLERVNVEGTLLVVREASRLLRSQGIGGDVVVISTKNVFAPGARFGAYSATKAAAHQVARIASLELAPIDVRVNMVAPDAVFSHGARRSGLWDEVGPDRMRARGLDEQGLEAYYRDRNLLKAAVTARHVGRAVLFFATRQTPTTGATLPVDGGLPDSTPR